MGKSESSVARTISALAMLLIASIVAGLLTAGLALPAVGAVGVTARAGVSLFDSLPGEMEVNPLAQASVFLAKDGTVIAEPYAENRVIIPISKISPHMQNAQVAIEDERFYEHSGIDIRGTMRAFVKNTTSDAGQGGSTLTQQYVKQQLLEGARRKGDTDELLNLSARKGVKGYVRKLRELKYAIALEKKYSKQQILQGYLNMVYFGDRTYGVEAAAQHYFSVPAKDLSIEQAALLAGLVQSPSRINPRIKPKAAKLRRDVVLEKMLKQGYITQEQHDKAVATPITLKLANRAGGGNCASAKYPYFCEYVFKWLKEQPSLGNNPVERENRILRDGLIGQTTLDLKKMKAMDEALKAKVPVGDSSNLRAAAVTVDPQNGNVLAMSQTTEYSLITKPGGTSMNYATDYRYGGSNGFQYGSTQKYFSVMEAVNQGWTVDSTINLPGFTQQPPLDGEGKPMAGKPPVNGYKFTNEINVNQGKCNNYGLPWLVTNVNGESHAGSQTLGYIAANSVNTGFVMLNSKLGFCKVHEMSKRLGLHQADAKEGEIPRVPSAVTLGSGNVAPLTLASSFAVMAGNGKLCTPIPVASITDYQKRKYAIPTAQERCKQVYDPQKAVTATTVLKEVTKQYQVIPSNGQPVAGKSGTSSLADATWFSGVSPRYSTSVWVGKENPLREGSKPLQDLTVGGKKYKGQVYSTTFAVPIWKEIMESYTQGEPVEDFSTTPPKSGSGSEADKPADGTPVAVPDLRGTPQAEAEAKLTALGFKVTINPGGWYTQRYDLGTVGKQNPEGGGTLPSGSTVDLYIVKGTNAPR